MWLWNGANWKFTKIFQAHTKERWSFRWSSQDCLDSSWPEKEGLSELSYFMLSLWWYSERHIKYYLGVGVGMGWERPKHQYPINSGRQCKVWNYVRVLIETIVNFLSFLKKYLFRILTLFLFIYLFIFIFLFIYFFGCTTQLAGS